MKKFVLIPFGQYIRDIEPYVKNVKSLTSITPLPKGTNPHDIQPTHSDCGSTVYLSAVEREKAKHGKGGILVPPPDNDVVFNIEDDSSNDKLVDLSKPSISEPLPKSVISTSNGSNLKNLPTMSKKPNVPTAELQHNHQSSEAALETSGEVLGESNFAGVNSTNNEHDSRKLDSKTVNNDKQSDRITTVKSIGENSDLTRPTNRKRKTNSPSETATIRKSKRPSVTPQRLTNIYWLTG